MRQTHTRQGEGASPLSAGQLTQMLKAQPTDTEDHPVPVVWQTDCPSCRTSHEWRLHPEHPFAERPPRLCGGCGLPVFPRRIGG